MCKDPCNIVRRCFFFFFFTFFKYLVKPLKTRHPARANCTKRKENHHRSSSSLDVSGQSLTSQSSVLKCFSGILPDVSHLLCSVTEVRLVVSIQTVTSPRIETAKIQHCSLITPLIQAFQASSQHELRCPTGALHQQYKCFLPQGA